MEKLKLLNIVKSNILTENRVDDAKQLAQQNGAIVEFPQILEISNQINPNHKYLRWLVDNYKTLSEKDENDIINILAYFEKNNNKFEKKDINSYDSFDELENTVIRNTQQIRREIQTVPGTDIIYDDKNITILIPETHESSCYYGAGTKWCTTTKDSSGNYVQYSSNGKLYYIISKTKPTSDKYYKIAVHMKYNKETNVFPPQPGIGGIYNAIDEVITENNLIDNTPFDVLNIIQDDFKQKWEIWWKQMGEEMKRQFKEKAEEEQFRAVEDQRRRRAEAERERVRRLERKQQADERRENGEYDDNEEVRALFEYLVDEGRLNKKDDEEVERITNEINILRQQLIDSPDNTEIEDQIFDLENELNDVSGSDIYSLFLEPYTHYGLSVYTNEEDGSEWAIGTDSEADKAAHEQVQNFIDEFRDQPGMGFSPGYIDYFIDGDDVASDFESNIEDMVRESPDSYLDDDDRELTSQAEKEIQEKRYNINLLEQQKEEFESKISDIEYEMSELDSDSVTYEELDIELADLQSDLETIDESISDLESEIEDIESDYNNDDYYEYSEDAIQTAIDNCLDEIRRDPVSELQDWGYTDFSRYVDEEKLIESVIRDDGRGHGLSNYDSQEREINYNSTWYYIYCQNQ